MAVSNQTRLDLYNASNCNFSETIRGLQNKLNTNSQDNANLHNALNSKIKNIHDVKQWICTRISNKDNSIPEEGINLLIRYIGYITILLLFGVPIPVIHSDVDLKMFDPVGVEEFELFTHDVEDFLQTIPFGETEQDMIYRLLHDAINSDGLMVEGNLVHLLSNFSKQTKKIHTLSQTEQLNCAVLLRRTMCLIYGFDSGEIMLTSGTEVA